MRKTPTAGQAWRPLHLIYLDETRTHEVHAEIDRRQDGLGFVTTEFPSGSRDPHEAVQLEEVLPSPGDVVARLSDLESRLTIVGKYWRADAADMTWARVTSASPPIVDLRAHEFPLPDDPASMIRFHHFHGGERDRLYVSMPRPDTSQRHILANLSFDFPRIDAAEIDILHSHLAPQLLQSSLVREHVELPKKGYHKLVEPKQYLEAYGTGWQEKARSTFTTAAKILLGRRPGGPLAHGAPRDQTRMGSELELALAAPVVVDALRRFLDVQQEESLIRGGEFVIRRWVNQRRRRADHHDQWRLSLAEASLLIRWAERAGKQSVIEDEGGKLMRAAHATR